MYFDTVTSEFHFRIEIIHIDQLFDGFKVDKTVFIQLWKKKELNPNSQI